MINKKRLRLYFLFRLNIDFDNEKVYHKYIKFV